MRAAKVPPVAGDPLDSLFAAPLDDFVETRDRLAAELRAAGRRDDADRLKAMRKPSAVVWALNQLARTKASGVRELRRAAETMRAVQEGRSRTSFAEAQRALLEQAWRLAEAATELLRSAGKRPGEGVTQRLDRALMAAVASPETSEALRAGRLTEEPEAIGFAGIGSVAPAPQRDTSSRRRPDTREQREAERDAARRAKIEDAQRELRAAKAEVARLTRDAEQAQKRVAALEKTLARLEA